MLGTIVNSAAIIAGGILGLIIKNNLPERFKQIINQAIGLAVVFIGISGSISKLILPDANPMLFILSLIIGSVLGEFLKIEDKLDALGRFLESKFSASGGTFAQGFVSASLVYCIGTMAIIGALESGIQGNHTVLFAKSVLDGVSSVVFASTLGLGVLFSSATVFVYQGSITLFARVISPYLTEQMINSISVVGGILITALGLKILDIKNFKVGNMLPAIIVPVVYYLIKAFI